MPTNLIKTSLNTEFVSESNGKHYSFCVRFIGINESNPKKSVTHILDNSSIDSFSWTNEINNILLTGELEYADLNGDISKFFGTYVSYIHVILSKNNTKERSPDRSINQEFKHLFLINNFEIIGRSGAIIVYKLHLVSAHWFKYISHVEFSNYKDFDHKEIFTIMKRILEITFDSSEDNFSIKCDSTSFENKKTNILLDYCTTTQTTCMSAIKYLQNKLIYFSDDKIIENLSFLVFDEFNNKIKLFNLTDQFDPKNNIISSNKLGTLMSLMGTDTEQYSQYLEQNFRSVIKKSNCQAMKSLMGNLMYKYNLSSNSFESYDINSNKISSIGISKNLANLNDEKNTYSPIFKPEIFNTNIGNEVDYKNYKNIGTTDNNNFSIYNDLIDNIINRNSLVLETGGEISHQPGQVFFISDDSEIAKKINDIDSLIIDKNRMFTGIFYIFKVRHIFKPGDKNGYSFYERLFISRTYNKTLTLDI